jgi:hypothetical protein
MERRKGKGERKKGGISCGKGKRKGAVAPERKKAKELMCLNNIVEINHDDVKLKLEEEKWKDISILMT